MKKIFASILLIAGLTITGCTSKSEETISNTYSNPELEFSVGIPNGWLQSRYTDYTNKPNSVIGAIDIDFSNMPQPTEGFNISNFPDNFERIDLRVFDINAESPNYSQQTAYYAEFLPTVDSYERSTKPLQITKYKIKDDKYLTLYIEETEQTFDSTSVIQADAFYKGKNYAYRFSNIFTPDKESSQKLIEEVMKPMLETFKELPE